MGSLSLCQLHSNTLRAWVRAWVRAGMMMELKVPKATIDTAGNETSGVRDQHCPSTRRARL